MTLARRREADRVELAATTLSRLILLAGPTALAFAAGGFFDQDRTVAAVVAWALVGLAAVTYRTVPVPRSRWGWAALAGLALLAGWVALSVSWAPLKDPAYSDRARLLLYLGAFIAASAAWSSRRAARWVEPGLAAGVLVVIGYGLSERLLPGVVTLERSISAVGRLEQPLTYWNAMGALAAIGLVLVVRMMGDATRPRALRAAAAAATVSLGAGLYLTLSRGAVGAAAVGLLVLALLAPTRAQLRALAIGVGAAAVAAGASSLFHGFESQIGTAAERQAQGLAMLAIIASLSTVAAVLQLRESRLESAAEAPRTRVSRRSPAFLGAVAALALAVPLSAVAVTAVAPNEHDLAKARNTTAFGSDRYLYWRLALRTAVAHPLAGVGTSGFQVEWTRARSKDEGAHDAHSLYLETAAELGLVGLATLGLFIAGVAGSARRAYARDPTLTVGWCAALAAFAFHAGLDWDWEMPALSLVAIVLAGAVVCRAGRPAAT